MAGLTLQIRPVCNVRLSSPSLNRGAAARRSTLVVRAVEKAGLPKGDEWDAADKKKSKGVAIGAAQWPPQPITETGKPKPEDDPANFEGGKRVRGPSEEEVQERREKQKASNPFQSPREGGSQMGGSAEGNQS